MTDLLKHEVPREQVQYLLGHSDARTTDLYNRTDKQVSRNIVARISSKLDSIPLSVRLGEVCHDHPEGT